jgi:hypothetical protein
VVEKVGRNAIAELVNQARNHPQRGDLSSANPAYVALAQIGQNFGIEGLALGVKNETGEISFLDLNIQAAPENPSHALSASSSAVSSDASSGASIDAIKVSSGEQFGDLFVDPFVDRARNKLLWRQLKKLVTILIDRNMLGPRAPIRSPEDFPDDFDEDLETQALNESKVEPKK